MTIAKVNFRRTPPCSFFSPVFILAHTPARVPLQNYRTRCSRVGRHAGRLSHYRPVSLADRMELYKYISHLNMSRSAKRALKRLCRKDTEEIRAVNPELAEAVELENPSLGTRYNHYTMLGIFFERPEKYEEFRQWLADNGYPLLSVLMAPLLNAYESFLQWRRNRNDA